MDIAIAARLSTAASDANGSAFASRFARLFSSDDTPPPAKFVSRADYIPEIDRRVNRLSVDVNLTQKILPPLVPRNASTAAVNLLQRISLGAEAMWRNPTRSKVSKWGRREVMHVFNGFFRQSTDLYEDYATFGRLYTCPDPFKNDDLPFTNGFSMK